ncbi:MAG: hypothetical protein M2R45_04503 [Verrucomicrobia subdivision 3 bacterium]|nr:hypothetical protein [Limisphaerales bacterium]MCS1415949.1 hypothetical protein [Limisphaerales bacterium]
MAGWSHKENSSTFFVLTFERIVTLVFGANVTPLNLFLEDSKFLLIEFCKRLAPFRVRNRMFNTGVDQLTF